MNPTVKKILALVLMCLCIKTVIAQTDSIKALIIEPDSIDTKYDLVYKLFVQENNHEIKHLLKLNLIGIYLNTPAITFEQKISKNLSFETHLYGAYKHLEYREYDSTFFVETRLSENSSIQSLSVGGYQMIKFYHNLRRRERLGKITNGFSANYFALKMSENYTWMDAYNSASDNNLKNIYYLTPGFAYGMQRRIGNIGFIECALNINNHAGTISNSKHKWLIGLETGLTIKMGFAIESLSGIKQILK
jgi:hypothetical protein